MRKYIKGNTVKSLYTQFSLQMSFQSVVTPCQLNTEWFEKHQQESRHFSPWQISSLQMSKQKGLKRKKKKKTHFLSVELRSSGLTVIPQMACPQGPLQIDGDGKMFLHFRLQFSTMNDSLLLNCHWLISQKHSTFVIKQQFHKTKLPSNTLNDTHLSLEKEYK